MEWKAFIVIVLTLVESYKKMHTKTHKLGGTDMMCDKTSNRLFVKCKERADTSFMK